VSRPASRTASPVRKAVSGASWASRPGVRFALLGALTGVLALVCLASLFIGSGDISAAAALDALRHGGSDTTAILVNQFRVPRMYLGVLVGAALAIAGALMQAVTRNPLADPGILGVNAGAYFAVVLAIAFTGATNISSYIGWALAGAGVTTLIVYLIGTRGRSGATPVLLVLAGVAVGAVLGGIGRGVTLLNPDVFDKIRFWNAGSLQGRQIDTVTGVLPFIVIGLVLALTLPRALNAVALGDDVAVSLGAHIARTRVLAVVAVTILCGAATAAAGPILFLGLLVPYIARSIVGPDQRWIFPFSLVLGPIVFLAADVLGRVLVDAELPVGIVTAFVGAPVLIALMRRRKVSQL